VPNRPMNQDIEAWFAKLSDSQRPLLLKLRQLILEAGDGITEEIKWGQPCYSKNKLFCYLQKSKTHVTIGFQQGAHLDDRNGILVGDGKDMRSVKLKLSDRIDSAPIKRLISDALKFDESKSNSV
jgi:hypothetical protein